MKLIELFTGDTLGAEPMTCPPDALQTGASVHPLAPGESLESTWGVRLF